MKYHYYKNNPSYSYKKTTHPHFCCEKKKSCNCHKDCRCCSCSAKYFPNRGSFSVFESDQQLFPNEELLIVPTIIDICPRCCFEKSRFEMAIDVVSSPIPIPYTFEATHFDSIRCESFETFGLELIASGVGRIESLNRRFRFNLSVAQSRNFNDFRIQLLDYFSNSILLDVSVRKFFDPISLIPLIEISDCQE